MHMSHLVLYMVEYQRRYSPVNVLELVALELPTSTDNGLAALVRDIDLRHGMPQELP
jgi:hypothetical protein